MTRPVQTAQRLDAEPDRLAALSRKPATSVFSGVRTTTAPPIAAPAGFGFNERMKMDGLEFLKKLPDAAIPAAFFDPQYRGVLDKLQYGNEGEKRGRRRFLLQQMSADTIRKFVESIDRCLIPSGHMFLWIDKYHLCEGFQRWFDGTDLSVVDLVNWDKCRLGMGYRSRRTTEHCVVLQKRPRKAKGVWKIHNIPDTWREKSINGTGHPHKKPVDLQSQLISAVTNEGDVVIDPAAGDFTVLTAANRIRRNFLGCDLNG